MRLPLLAVTAYCVATIAASAQDLSCSWAPAERRIDLGLIDDWAKPIAKFFDPSYPLQLSITQEEKDLKVAVQGDSMRAVVGYVGTVTRPDQLSIYLRDTRIKGLQDSQHEVTITIDRYSLDTTLIVARFEEGKGRYGYLLRKGKCVARAL